MPITATATPGPLPLTPKDHALVMIDFPSQMAFHQVHRCRPAADALRLRSSAAPVA